jgi:hypothetical protein
MSFLAGHSEGFLAVRFPFDTKVVGAMRTVPGRRWSAGDQAWLIPNGKAERERLLNALYDTGMFSRFDSSDTRCDDSFDETFKLSGEPSNPAIIAPGRFRHTAQWVRCFLDLN